MWLGYVVKLYTIYILLIFGREYDVWHLFILLNFINKAAGRHFDRAFGDILDYVDCHLFPIVLFTRTPVLSYDELWIILSSPHFLPRLHFPPLLPSLSLSSLHRLDVPCCSTFLPFYFKRKFCLLVIISNLLLPLLHILRVFFSIIHHFHLFLPIFFAQLKINEEKIKTNNQFS